MPPFTQNLRNSPTSQSYADCGTALTGSYTVAAYPRSASGAWVSSCGVFAVSDGLRLSCCSAGSVRIRLWQVSKIVSLGRTAPSVSLRGCSSSCSASHPATRSLLLLTKSSPLSANSSTALLPVSCRRFHRSGGARRQSMCSPAVSQASICAAASEMMSPGR